ncbi:MAG: PBP1A family penicillin-binding protein [Sutterellaceae bacterium]|nr:PBP1A family penicillin-binding protein [Sutterellaceae bacterium]MDY2867169.1 PBP1A family penicillin-binding protein [Mesosutterella sp.]
MNKLDNNHKKGRLLKAACWIGGILSAGAACGFLLFTFLFAIIYSQLPDMTSLRSYVPKMPLRIWSADGQLLAEYGEERRDYVLIKELPKQVKLAILAAEDSDFYQHSGVEFSGIGRAVIANILTGRKSQGGSTITMQVARNCFLSSEKSYMRKLYEIAIATKMEHQLSKDQILEIYVNQIYLGQRAYGFGSASRTYFGKPLKDLTVGEAATLAGLPVAPSAYNPVVNNRRATMRRNYVLGRMATLGFITEQRSQEEQAKPVYVKDAVSDALAGRRSPKAHAEYATELARQMVYDIFKEDAYTRGLNVYLTINSGAQKAAYNSVRSRLISYDRSRGYRGAEAQMELPADPAAQPKAIRDALRKVTTSPNLLPAVVVSTSPSIRATFASGETVTLNRASNQFGANYLKAGAPGDTRIRPGSIIRVSHGDGGWTLAQVPLVQTGFMAADFRTGAVRALVGGFDYDLNMFNHVTQAWRQPGSSFKPFVYSASLEKGYTPLTTLQDEPFTVSAKEAGGTAWTPKNYSGKFEGPMPLHRALEKSQNIPVIRVMQNIGPKYAREFITRFGFPASRHPATLSTALGAGTVTIWQMCEAYSIFANGGYRVQPFLIDKIVDDAGRVLMAEENRNAGDESIRAIPARNAFVMSTLLNDVARRGTAARAGSSLGRPDVGAKTGTSNDSNDAWFAGFAGNLVAVGWMGYDQMRSLGAKATGGSLVQPIWIEFMQTAVRGQPIFNRLPPSGVVQREGEWCYRESAPEPQQAAPKDSSSGAGKNEDPIGSLLKFF